MKRIRAKDPTWTNTTRYKNKIYNWNLRYDHHQDSPHEKTKVRCIRTVRVHILHVV